MAPPAFNFNVFMEKEKLAANGSNFTNWAMNLRILPTAAQKQYVIDTPLGPPPAPDAPDEEKNVYITRQEDHNLVHCGILYGLEPELRKRFENGNAFDTMGELKMIFDTHAAVESYNATEKFFSCMMEENNSVSEHVPKMSGYADKLVSLGITIPIDLGIHRVLQSLPPSYKSFVMNYNMQGMKKSLPELLSMLKTTEVEIRKEHQVLMINKTTGFKKDKKGKQKGKKGGKSVAAPEKKPRAGPKSDTECYYCKGTGHWKRNCPKYLADKKAGKANKGICDIHVIDVYLTSTRSSTWVFDTGSVANICNSVQGLRNKRQLARDEVTMRVGNGSRVDVIAVGTLPLHMPSGLVINLNNCYFVPALSMNIVSGSCLMRSGYSFKSENNACSIYMDNIFYGHAPVLNGLFLLDLNSSIMHIHYVDAKRVKLDDDISTYMWHCRLGHIDV